VTLRFAEESRHIFRNARIQPSAHSPAAQGFDFGNQWRELFAIPATCEHNKSLGREFSRNRCSNVISGANDRD
jgi:hypothetical protein